MIRVGRALKSERTMKALTGLSPKEFCSLVPTFENVLKDYPSLEQLEQKKNRLRAPGGGCSHTRTTSQDKLFYILFYVKCYPTFDVAAFFFDVDRSRTCRWTHALLPILEKTLDEKVVLPLRKITSIEDFQKHFPEVKAVLIDGTERPIRRPVNKVAAEKNYSGKKSDTRKKTF
jgi:hypothetical protein